MIFENTNGKSSLDVNVSGKVQVSPAFQQYGFHKVLYAQSTGGTHIIAYTLALTDPAETNIEARAYSGTLKQVQEYARNFHPWKLTSILQSIEAEFVASHGPITPVNIGLWNSYLLKKQNDIKFEYRKAVSSTLPNVSIP